MPNICKKCREKYGWENAPCGDCKAKTATYASFFMDDEKLMAQLKKVTSFQKEKRV